MRAAFGLVVLALASAGCQAPSVACDGSCPAIAGTYAVTSSTLSGTCGFTPWLLEPTLTLQQATGSGTVTFDVVDPVEQLSVPVTAEVRVPVNGGSVADIAGFLRAVRSAQTMGPIVELQLTFNGVVVQQGTTRTLSGSLSTRDVQGDGCIVEISFEGTQTVAATP